MFLGAVLLVPAISLTGCASRRVSSSNFRQVAAVAQETADQEEESPSQLEEISGPPVNRGSNPNYSTQFDWPVDEAKLTRGFLPLRKKRPHLGIDLAAPTGTPILAAHDGTVIYTGRDFRGYGKMIMIEGREGFATLYAHLSKITIQEGDKVHKGDQIGLMGRTGRASGTHLHFEVRTDRGPVDPLLYLPNGAMVARVVSDKKKTAH